MKRETLTASAAHFEGVPQEYQGAPLRWCWRYLNRDGTEALGIVPRYDPPEGRKQFPPHFTPNGRDGFSAGYPKGKEYKRPLFGLHTLDRSGPVYVVEGERCAAALHGLGWAAVCSPGGAQAPSYADWTPLDGAERVIILPDKDDAGEKYAEAVAGILANLPHPPKLERCTLPGLAKGGDVADWMALEYRAWDGYSPLPRMSGDGVPEALDEMIRGHAEPFALAQATAAKPKGRQIKTVCIADVEREEVAWRWPGYLPCGKLIVLDGDPGVGKSSITMDWAARVSQGGSFPGCADALPAAGVLVIAMEDGLADTVRPRLEAAGADLSVVHAPEPGEYPAMPAAADWLLGFIEAKGIGLVIIDPIMALLGGKDSHRDSDTREVLTPLCGVADATGASIVIVRHLNKAQGGPAIHRGGGSIAFTAAARVALVAGKAPDDSGRFALAVSKNNLAASPSGLFYTLRDRDGAPCVAWGESAPFDADELVSQPERSSGPASAKDEAAAFLRAELADGPLPASEIKARAMDAGIATKTLERAKEDVGVTSDRTGGLGRAGYWVWTPPPA
jgi:hypothetical protein